MSDKLIKTKSLKFWDNFHGIIFRFILHVCLLMEALWEKDFWERISSQRIYLSSSFYFWW